MLVNGISVLVLHLRCLKDLIAFRLFARRFVIARLSVKFRLVVIGIEPSGIWPIPDIHDRIRCQEFIEFTPRDKNRRGDNEEKKAKGHECGLTYPIPWSTVIRR
jgi:hypothetical protein